MPLPIPDIMENASNALVAAQAVANLPYLGGAPIPKEITHLREALKKISPADLLAVLNEIGKVYVGINNIQILKIGSSPQAKIFNMMIEVEYGLGPRTIVIPIPAAGAADLIKKFQETLRAVEGGATPGKLITDAGSV